MRYLLLVCWDRERMDAQDEPEPGRRPTTRASRGSTTSGHAGSG